MILWTTNRCTNRPKSFCRWIGIVTITPLKCILVWYILNPSITSILLIKIIFSQLLLPHYLFRERRLWAVFPVYLSFLLLLIIKWFPFIGKIMLRSYFWLRIALSRCLLWNGIKAFDFFLIENWDFLNFFTFIRITTLWLLLSIIIFILLWKNIRSQSLWWPQYWNEILSFFGSSFFIYIFRRINANISFLNITLPLDSISIFYELYSSFYSLYLIWNRFNEFLCQISLSITIGRNLLFSY